MVVAESESRTEAVRIKWSWPNLNNGKRLLGLNVVAESKS